MKDKTRNPDFTYEIACDQLCGRSHYTMRGVIVVESQEDFDAYMASLKPEYYKAFPDLDPDKIVVRDSITKSVVQNIKK
jgi:cytochrome c oxidase subunit 2